jgi:hypothetical protein
MSPAKGSYLLDLIAEYDHYTERDSTFPILDCYDQTRGEKAGCLVSMANTAAGLYDRMFDTSLRRKDNNAAVKVIMRDGALVAVLYAIRTIPPGEEILWDYGIYKDDDDDTPAKGTPASLRHTPTMSTPVAGPFSSNSSSEKCLATTTGKDSFHPDFVILDSASGTNLCRSEKHASDLKACNTGVITGIEGASGGTEYNQSCTFVDPAFGLMPLAIGASANIISFAVARDRGFKAEYCNQRDEFALISPRGGRYRFGRLTRSTGTPSKFYVMSLDTLLPPSEDETRVLCAMHQRDEHDPEPGEEPGQKYQSHVTSSVRAPVSTVSGNQQKYTKAQNQQAVLAKEFLASMGHPSLEVAIKQARGMMDCPVTSTTFSSPSFFFAPFVIWTRCLRSETVFFCFSLCKLAVTICFFT